MFVGWYVSVDDVVVFVVEVWVNGVDLVVCV